MTLLAIAAVLMALIAGVHIFAGSRTDVAPLLASNMPEPARSTLYYCWHLVSIMLVAMALAYAMAALDEQYLLLAKAATLLAGLFAFWGFVAGLMRRQSLITQLPQGLMFALVTIVATAALGAWL